MIKFWWWSGYRCGWIIFFLKLSLQFSVIRGLICLGGGLHSPSASQFLMKKALEETQTLRDGCSKAEPKKFAPPKTPFPGAQDGQDLISWRWSLPSPTNPVWWRSMHVISSYRGNRWTHKTQTHNARPPVANTQTGPITIHCAVKISAQCKNLCDILRP